MRSTYYLTVELLSGEVTKIKVKIEGIHTLSEVERLARNKYIFGKIVNISQDKNSVRLRHEDYTGSSGNITRSTKSGRKTFYA